MLPDSADKHAWIVIAASSAALCMGTSLIWSDAIWNSIFNRKINILTNRGFLVMSLCLSSGLLISTALNSLMPSALSYISLSGRLNGKNQNLALLIALALGVAACMMLNFVIHVFTAQSIVHCAHEDPHHTHEHNDETSNYSDTRRHSRSTQDHSQHYHGHSHDHGLDHSDTPTQSDHSHDHFSVLEVRRGRPAVPACTTSKQACVGLIKDGPLLEPQSVSPQTPSSGIDKSYGAIVNTGEVISNTSNLDCSLRSTKSMIEPHDVSKITERMPLLHTSHAHDQHEMHHHSSHSHLRQHFSVQLPDQQVRPTQWLLRAKARSFIDRTSSIFRPSNSETVGNCHGFQTLVSCADDTHRELCCCHERDLFQSIPPEVYFELNGDTSGSHRQHSSNAEIRIPSQSIHDAESGHSQIEPHHHHVVSQFGELFSIGIQTALAISLHKIPEGFMLFATDREDKDLGMSLFLALFLHNVLEGFTMASPLYLAFSSRSVAAFYACILGGGSQPLGALLARAVLPAQGLDNSTYLEFGLLIAATGGFMTVISFQMFATAVKYGGSQNQVVGWSLVGCLLMFAIKCL